MAIHFTKVQNMVSRCCSLALALSLASFCVCEAEEELLLVGSRSPPGSNFIQFKCISDQLLGVGDPEAVFLLNGTELGGSPTDGSGDGDGVLQVEISRELEGEFSCQLPSSPNRTSNVELFVGM